MNKFTTKALQVSATIALTLSLASCQYFQPEVVGQKEGKEYTITIKNGLANEKFAPVLIASDANDNRIWVDKYVSTEAHIQFTTGNNGPLAKKLGGDQGQPGKIGVGQSVTFKFRTNDKTARITAMVHPDFTPDNYVTALVDLEKGGVTELKRFDIGDNEGRKTVEFVSSAGKVIVE